ncbi:MAG: rRNA maturation RNase YbeY [Deltaproteobacteria bacterium]|nr:rRNA maturation RNase YbeY [Deltaproteobacteria bacterium]
MPVWLRSRGLERRSVRHGELSWRAEAMLDSLDLADAELSILLCDDGTIRKLNRRYRKKNKATDVLAFPMQEGPGPAAQSGLLGDVVISLPTATRQAAEHDRPIIQEVTFLLAHGLLHLLGYDHANRREEQDMKARTEGLLAAVDAAR